MRELSRASKLKLNSVLAIVNQIIIIVHGLILPRLFIGTYGSDVYGLISSATQFLGVVSLMELGIGAVLQSSLYKPLARRDSTQISKIIKSAERFFTRIGIALAVYTIFLSVIYPLYIKKDFGWSFEATLILIISVNSLAEYFFGITYRLLVVADQRAYINLSLQCVSYIANIAICVWLMNAGATVHIVKLCSAVIFLFKPAILMFYVRKRYNIDKKITYTEEPIKQKWNGVAQHIAYYVTLHTDVIVLTVFSSLQNVAVYSVYNIVTNGVSTLIFSLNNGTQALLGNMLANKEFDKLKSFFDKLEWTIHNIVVFFYSCVGLLIVPFVSVYINGVKDADYYQPLFAVILSIASAMYCLRLPYNMMVFAAGHYKQTQTSSIIEMSLNLGISLVLVNFIGLMGVAIGTLVALTYRTLYLVFYLSKNIINHEISKFVKQFIKDIVCTACIILTCQLFSFEANSFLTWFILAVKVAGVAIAEIIIFNFLFDRNRVLEFIRNKKLKKGTSK